jgi:hypothetical protein
MLPEVSLSSTTPSVTEVGASSAVDQTLTEALNNMMISSLVVQLATDQAGIFNPANEAINESYSE